MGIQLIGGFMMGMIFYLRLLSGLGFLIGGIAFLYEKRKNPKKLKNSYLPSILFILAGIFQLISALAYVLDKTGQA
jgi:hypothetical protein